MVRIISSIVGFINGVGIVTADSSYFNSLSFYDELFFWLPHSLFNVFFYSSFILFSIPLSGALLGAIIGYCVSLLYQPTINPIVVENREIFNGAIFGCAAGFLSMGLLFLNIYAT